MENKKKSNGRTLLSLILLVLVVIVCFYIFNSGDNGEKITVDGEKSISAIMNSNGENHMEDIYIEGYNTYGTIYIRMSGSSIKKNQFPKYSDYYLTYNTAIDLEKVISYIEEFNKKVDFAKAKVVENPEITTITYSDGTDITAFKDFKKIERISSTPSAGIIETILPYASAIVMLFIGFMLFRMLSSKGGVGNQFSKNRARMVERSDIRFKDIAGADEEKEETQEIVEFLKTPEKFKALGARIPKGVLLVGQPGTGKTLLAKAVAGESNVPFFSISGSDFVELYVGVGASRVRDLFDTAKKNAPCIVFIDEIDAVGRQRGAGLGGGNDEREQTLNQLLVEMDGFESNDGIIVMAATNRADVLDPALLRPGRFDRQIYVNVPDVKGREGIIKIHAKNKPIDSEVDFTALARLTSGFTGADIENFLNEAAIMAARNNHVTINMSDITEGINKVLMGPQKKSRLVTENTKKLTAYHEAGHAIIAKLLDFGDEVHEVSIIPRGMAGGYTSTRPANDDDQYTLNKLNKRICMLMGGRVAEEIMFGDISAGASSDIQRATEIARRMVTEWGMSKKLGCMSLGKSDEVFIGRDYQTKSNYSESFATIIDNEIKDILDTCYEQTTNILKSNKNILDNFANLLLEEETIYEDEVNAIMNGEDYTEVAKRLNEKIEQRKEFDRKRQEEQKMMQEIKMQEMKEQTAIALKNAGVISDKELEAIKLDTLRIKAKYQEAKANSADSENSTDSENEAKSENENSTQEKVSDEEQKTTGKPKKAHTKKVEKVAEKAEKEEKSVKKTTKKSTKKDKDK